MQTRYLILAVSLCMTYGGTATADEHWQHGACRNKDITTPVIDFHAHTFNFRHLPLRGILYGWGVPDFVASIAADIVWGLTDEMSTGSNSDFNSLRYDPDDAGFIADFRSRAMSPQIDFFQVVPDSLDPDEQQRFENDLDEYLAAEISYEQSPPGGFVPGTATPLTDYFTDLAALVAPAGASTTDFSALAEEGPQPIRAALAQLSVKDKIVALLVKPFKIVDGVRGAFRFFSVMIQGEDKIAERLFKENCRVDYFVHHMMDLEPVYNDRPPVVFYDQHDVVRKVRAASGERMISFSAFVPFRFEEFQLDMLQYAMETGVIGAKYYPPSGYGATVGSIPDKPKRWRGIIYQGGARKQWKHRYDPLNDQQVRNDWGVVVHDPGRAREETLEGVSARFFQFAADEDLIVFAHQSPGGFEAYPGYGSMFAEPCTWLPVVDAHPDILLVLGHAGGFAWYSDDAGFDSSFARQAYNMCVTYENVYCDFGYHEEILTDAGQTALRDRLLKFHAAGTTPGSGTLKPQSCRQQQAPMRHSIFDKLLYGSDWMMVVKERDYEKMTASFEKVFTGQLQQYRSRFFGENALRLLRKSGNADQLPASLPP